MNVPLSPGRFGYKNLCFIWRFLIAGLSWFIYTNLITAPPPAANSHSVLPVVLWFLVDHTCSFNNDIKTEDLGIRSPTSHLWLWDGHTGMINRVEIFFFRKVKYFFCNQRVYRFIGPSIHLYCFKAAHLFINYDIKAENLVDFLSIYQLCFL